MKIREVIEMIGSNEIYLPAIQRRFVWKHPQIEKLFDSIMRDYPIGTFLFWFLKGDKIKDYTFYKFLKNYHQKDNDLNEVAPKPELKENIIGILDGQQRLSSIYIALQGTYAYKLPYYHYTSQWAFPVRKFYLNLFNVNNRNESEDCVYDFKFLTDKEAQKTDENNLWFLVRRVLEWKKASEVNKFYRELMNKHKGTEFINILEPKQDDIDDILTDLWHKLTTSEIINYYKIDEPELDNILDIFVRVNSGGTVLSKSDLLFSTIVAHWQEGREKIEDLMKQINKKGDGFFFDNDFIMRSCLVLTDSPVLFKVGNFKQENIEKIKKQWPNIVKATNDTVDLLAEFGFSGDTITSQNAIIPIVYYILKDGQINEKTKKEIKKFLIHGFIKQVYGGQGDRVLSNIREGLSEKDVNNCFILRSPKFLFNDILNIKLPGNKSFKVTEDDLEEILDYKKGAYSFMILTLLYPHLKYDQIKFHQDHLHPNGLFNKTGFQKNNISEDNWENYLYLKDRLPNLQLLEGGTNKSKNKTPLKDWVNKKNIIPDLVKYKNDNFIPNDANFEFENFKEFYNKRRKIIKKNLKGILYITGIKTDGNTVNSQSN